MDKVEYVVDNLIAMVIILMIVLAITTALVWLTEKLETKYPRPDTQIEQLKNN